MGPFGPIEWLIIGAAVGMLARLFLPGATPVGCLGTIFIGIAGAVIGGKLWEEIFGRQRGVAWIGSILVAMLLLAIFRRLTYQRYWG
ncbi:MAG: GlsB/YeaQ/YmgE family stress response membrane protein [Actinomycetota bacterium]|nr:GlsB/YeaQ/YmgE family stress response membrane protein [Actinomycetota bacterium]